jgi:hypothetical protein
LAAAAVTPLALATLAVSAAAWTDEINLNFSANSFGSPSEFQLVIVSDGVVHRGTNLSVPVPDWQLLFPGHAVTSRLILANNSVALGMQVHVTLDALPSTDQTYPGPDISGYLRFSVVDNASGQVLLGDPSQPGNGADRWSAAFDLGTLGPRYRAALKDSDAWIPGPADSWRDLTVYIYLLDHPDLESRQSGWSTVMLRTDAVSVGGP